MVVKQLDVIDVSLVLRGFDVIVVEDRVEIERG
jgi:hypothetical protein